MTVDDRWRAANGNSAAMFACRGQRTEVLRVLIDRCGAAAFSGKNFKKVARLVANQMPGIDTVRAQENSRAACVGNVSDVGCIRWARRSRHLADRDRVRPTALRRELIATYSCSAPKEYLHAGGRIVPFPR